MTVCQLCKRMRKLTSAAARILDGGVRVFSLLEGSPDRGDLPLARASSETEQASTYEGITSLAAVSDKPGVSCMTHSKLTRAKRPTP